MTLTDCTPSSGIFTILSPDNITTLNQCTTFTGNISVAAKGIEHITLDGLKAITGTFRVTDVEAILSISSTTLESVSTLILNNLPQLTTLTLPALNNFSKLDLAGLNALRGCEIATGTLKRDVREISIVGTALETMDWLRWPVASSMVIAANMNLTSFKLPYDRIGAGSSYQISVNTALSDLDFSQLSGIYGSLAVNGNKDADLSFDKLETIDGYVRISQHLTNMTMPVLTSINGALRAESSGDILSFCNWLSTQTRLLGHYDCTANNTNPIISSTVSKAPATTTGSIISVKTNTISSSNDTSDYKPGLSTGTIVGIAVAMVVVISFILTSMALLLFRRRSRNKEQAALKSEGERKTHSTSTMGKELDTSGIDYELEGTDKAHELPAAELARELDGESLQEMECEKPYFRDQKPALNSPIGRFELP